MPSFTKPKRYWPFIAAGITGYTIYVDHIKPVPRPVAHTADQRNVVVVGGGLIGLSTAYFLCQNEANKVKVLVESR